MSRILLARRCRVAAVSCLLLAALQARASDQQSPVIRPGQPTSVESIANDILLNGRRSRIERSVYAMSIDDSAQLFTEAIGRLHQVQGKGSVRLVSGRHKDHFVTVRLERLDEKETAATVMTTALSGGQLRVDASTRQWLPIGSSVVSSMLSNDPGRSSLVLIAASRIDLYSLREAFMANAKQDGFKVIHQADHASAGMAGWVATLDGTHEQVLVTIDDVGAARSIVIQRTRELGR